MSWREGLWSALAAGVAISLNAWVSHLLLPGDYRVYLAASMGASTILALVVYHSPLSQPRVIVGGHLAGAVSGLLAASLVADPVLACMAAMTLTVLIQVPARCLHAPGGGTALLPILGGAVLQSEGLGFILVVLLNALVLTAMRSMEGYIDVSPEDLERIYERARDHLRQHWDGVAGK